MAAGSEERRERTVCTVLFDLDGTLADTLPSLAGALNAALAESGRTGISADALRPVITHGTRAIVARGLGDAAGNEALSRALSERFLAHYEVATRTGASLFPGIADVLAALAARGIRWGVVTNKLTRFARPLVAHIDAHGECACLIGGDSALHPKPHPAPLLLACRETGSAPFECVYVGDTQDDIVAGRRAGMRTVAAAYGYLPGGADPGAWGADAVVGHPDQLLPALVALAGERG